MGSRELVIVASMPLCQNANRNEKLFDKVLNIYSVNTVIWKRRYDITVSSYDFRITADLHNKKGCTLITGHMVQ